MQNLSKLHKFLPYTFLISLLAIILVYLFFFNDEGLIKKSSDGSYEYTSEEGIEKITFSKLPSVNVKKGDAEIAFTYSSSSLDAQKDTTLSSEEAEQLFEDPGPSSHPELVPGYPNKIIYKNIAPNTNLIYTIESDTTIKEDIELLKKPNLNEGEELSYTFEINLKNLEYKRLEDGSISPEFTNTKTGETYTIPPLVMTDAKGVTSTELNMVITLKERVVSSVQGVDGNNNSNNSNNNTSDAKPTTPYTLDDTPSSVVLTAVLTPNQDWLMSKDRVYPVLIDPSLTWSQANWFDDSYSYRQTVSITNTSGGNVTNQRVKVTLDTATLITAGKMQSDCDDIRVTDINGKLLDHWDASCNSATTSIYVKIPTITTLGAVLFIYYGNSTAQSVEKTLGTLNNPGTSCKMMKSQGSVTTNGVYYIVPGGNDTDIIQVFCDVTTLSEGWTVVLNSNRAVTPNPEPVWNDAINSVNTTGTFGNNLNSFDLILGLKHWNYIGSTALLNFGSNATTLTKQATYSSITLNSGNYYAITLGTETIALGGVSSGLKTFSSASNFKFTTTDADNDTYTSNCATVFGGSPWWYGGCWSGSFWGGGDGGSYQNAPYWTGSTTDYNDHASIMLGGSDTMKNVTTAAPTNEEKSPAPVAYWKFDEGSGVVAQNSTWQKTGTVTNLITNPSFEVDTAGWVATNTTITATNAIRAFSGTKYQSVVGTGAGTYPRSTYTFSGLSTGTHSLQFRYKADASVASTGFWYMWALSPSLTGLAGGSFTNTGVTDASGWATVKTTFTVVAGQSNFQLWFYLNGIASSTGTLLIDGVQVETGSTTNLYCDGSLQGNGSHVWNGTAHASTSTCDVGTDGELINSPAWQTEDMCVSGKCLKFDGVDDQVTVSDHDALDLNELTLSAWIRRTGASGDSVETIINKNKNYILRLTSTGYLVGYYWPESGTNRYNYTSTQSIADNKWQYVTLTIPDDPSQAFFTVDGEIVNISYTNTSEARTPTNPVTIGGVASANENFKGFIDEPKIYPYARTADQIKQDYLARGGSTGVQAQFGYPASKSGLNLSQGLVGYWKMDEASWIGTAGEVIDASGNGNNGVRAGDATTVGGKYGNGGNFDGTGDYVSVADASSLDITDKITLSAWVNFSAVTSWDAIICKRATSGDDEGRSYCLSRNNDSNTYVIGLYGSSDNAQSSSTTISTGVWRHVVGTWDGSTIRIYVDGQLEGSTAFTSVLNTNNGALNIGRSGDYGYYALNGKMDEVRIYNRALSEGEVRSLYNWAPGPVAYWDFNENTGTTTNDKSGNGNTGTLTNGPTWTSGKYGSGLKFDGVNDYALTSSNVIDSIGPTSTLTVGAWLKASSTQTGESDRRAAVARDVQTNEFEIVLGSPYSAASQSRWSIEVGKAGVGSQNASSIATYTVGTWYYVVGVFRSGSADLYVDGVYQSTVTYNGTVNTATTHSSPWHFGSEFYNGSQGYEFDGAVDDVKIYNYARTPAQIIEDMNAGHPAPGSPVASALAHYKFDEGYGTTVTNFGNAGSTLNGTLTNMASPATSTSGWTNDGKFGKALVYDGSNDHVAVTTSTVLDFSSSFTLATWVKLDATGADKRLIDRTNNGYGYALSVNNGVPRFITGNGSTYDNLDGAITLATGTWYHIVGAVDAGAKRLYVNGKQVGAVSSTVKGAATTLTLRIGTRDASTQTTSGTIDEAKIYNFGLTEDQVRAEYNQGKATVFGSVSTASDGKTSSFSASREYCVPGDTSSCSAPVGEWKFDENTGTTSVYDTSGNGNTGTMQGSMTTSDWVPGKIGSALDFDGTDDRITASSISGLTSTQTKSAWIYPRSFSVGMNYYVIDEGSNNNWVQLYDSDSDGLPIIRAGFQGGQFVDTSYELPSANRWYYLAITSTSNNITIYLDGVQMATGTKTSQTPGSITIADYGGTGYRFRGVIDQIRIYNYVRTPAQIAWEYNRGAPVAWYKFDECSGTTIYNSAKNGNGDAAGLNGVLSIGGNGSNTSVGTCSTSGAWADGATGKIGSSMDFDGTDDLVTVSDGTDSLIDSATGAGQARSVSLWFKHSFGNYNVVMLEKGTNKHFVLQTGNSSYCGIGKLAWRVNTTTNSSQCTTKTVNDGQWHHFVGIYDGTKSIKYVDGIKDVNEYTETAPADDNDAFVIGERANLTYGYLGLIDDVRIYNYALTEAQVKEVYNDGAVSFK